MSIKLSNSAITLYQQCGMKYKYHYIDRWRSKLCDSPLFFGSAIDNALNVLLLTKKKLHTPEEKELVSKDYKLVFEEALTNVKLGTGDIADIRKSELARYFASDLDITLWDKKDEFEYLEGNELELSAGNYKEWLETWTKERKEKKILGVDEFRAYNYACWITLKVKGLMLLEEYKNTILPQIKEVHEIQKAIHLPNQHGDVITGYIDFVATFEDGIKRVMDNKTSSSAYTEQNILDSQQLVIYTENQQNYKCGFAVLEKKIRKRDPRVRSYLIFGEITDEQVEKYFSEIEYVLEDIKAEKFEKNEDSCFAFGKPCIYYNLCHKNDYSELTKLDKK